MDTSRITTIAATCAIVEASLCKLRKCTFTAQPWSALQTGSSQQATPEQHTSRQPDTQQVAAKSSRSNSIRHVLPRVISVLAHLDRDSDQNISPKVYPEATFLLPIFFLVSFTVVQNSGFPVAYKGFHHSIAKKNSVKKHTNVGSFSIMVRA